jgi:hypothetical protein
VLVLVLECVAVCLFCSLSLWLVWVVGVLSLVACSSFFISFSFGLSLSAQFFVVFGVLVVLRPAADHWPLHVGFGKKTICGN